MSFINAQIKFPISASDFHEASLVIFVLIRLEFSKFHRRISSDRQIHRIIAFSEISLQGSPAAAFHLYVGIPFVWRIVVTEMIRGTE